MKGAKEKDLFPTKCVSGFAWRKGVDGKWEREERKRWKSWKDLKVAPVSTWNWDKFSCLILPSVRKERERERESKVPLFDAIFLRISHTHASFSRCSFSWPASLLAVFFSSSSFLSASSLFLALLLFGSWLASPAVTSWTLQVKLRSIEMKNGQEEGRGKKQGKQWDTCGRERIDAKD